MGKLPGSGNDKQYNMDYSAIKVTITNWMQSIQDTHMSSKLLVYE